MVLGSPDSHPLLVETAALGLLDCGVTCLTFNMCFSLGQMHVYSLGMTLYWSAGFRVPPNQVCKQGCNTSY